MIQLPPMLLDYATKPALLRLTWAARFKIACLILLAALALFGGCGYLSQWWRELSAIKDQTMKGFVWDSPAAAFTDSERRSTPFAAALLLAAFMICSVQVVRICNAPDSRR
jgi:hypothetical protein